MREQIIEILKNSSKAPTTEQINSLLGFKTVDELKEVIQTLRKLEEEAIISETKKGGYIISNNKRLKSGKLMVVSNGNGFVDIGLEDDVKITPDNMGIAINDDIVLIELSKNKKEARVVKILRREPFQIVGECFLDNNIIYVKSDNNKLNNINVMIDAKDTMGAAEGQKVVVEVDPMAVRGRTFKGVITEILGFKNDFGVQELSVIRSYKIKDVFNKETEEEAETVPSEITDDDLKGRTDLRNNTIFTIDGDDAKDLDDAISIEKLVDGTYKLGVHIADVSYYVKKNGALDTEAADRGTSVYLYDRVIPMLPPKLSNGICSLNGNVDRLTITCDMWMDNKGKVYKHDIYPSVINSKKRMTYKNVNKILDQNEIPEGYEPFVESLKLMKEVADIHRHMMIARGYISFDIPEIKILVDKDGVPTGIDARNSGTGEKLIEDFMLAANETVAEHLFHMDLPCAYRIHKSPKKEDLKNFLAFISLLGYNVQGNFDKPTPTIVQSILNQLKDKKEFSILSELLLRKMPKAVYSPGNVGHFGIGSDCYCHFTSPIRRYPDQTVHRILRELIFSGELDNQKLNYWEQKLPSLCEHSSLKEQASEKCERDINDIKAAEYMEKHIGEEYDGVISDVKAYGFYVRLANLIEGLVNVKNLSGFYNFNELRYCLTENNGKNKYAIGDEIRVKVIGSSKETGNIDFEPVKVKKL